MPVDGHVKPETVELREVGWCIASQINSETATGRFASPEVEGADFW